VIQEKPSSSISPASCSLDRVDKCARIWLAFADHLVVPNNKSGVMLTGTPELLFQPQALIAGFHNMATPSTLHKSRIPQQGLPGYRVTPTIPRTVGDGEEF